MVYKHTELLDFLDFFHRPMFLGVEEDDVSETGSVSILRWLGEKTPNQLSP
jgi:hypothetical protein